MDMKRRRKSDLALVLGEPFLTPAMEGCAGGFKTSGLCPCRLQPKALTRPFASFRNPLLQTKTILMSVKGKDRSWMNEATKESRDCASCGHFSGDCVFSSDDCFLGAAERSVQILADPPPTPP